MISFRPLKWTMKERHITCRQLSDMTGIHYISVTNAVSEKFVPSTEFVEKVCKALNCSIEDVIAWKEEDDVVEERRRIKWDMVTVPLRKLSVMIGKSQEALVRSRKTGTKLSMEDIRKIASVIGCNEEDLCEV